MTYPSNIITAKDKYFYNCSSKKRRLENFYWITTKKGNQVLKFKPNWAQEELKKNEHSKNLILKARQLGMSTMIQIDILDDALTIPNLSCGIIADTLDNAEEIFEKKLKFAYDRLDPITRSAVQINTNNTRELSFSNGSVIRVGTSLRGGTIHRLHISEFGKICKKYPEKAREIISGALNTVDIGSGGKIWIESTAEGREGYFYDYVQEAIAHEKSGYPLTPMDFKFFFFSWWKHPDYVLNQEYPISYDLQEYFKSLEDEHGIILNDNQKWWYASKTKEQRGDIFREFPSVPSEAFEASSEGLYYAKQINILRERGQIGIFPPDPIQAVEVSWDLGYNDATALWGFQRQGVMARLVFYYENSGEPLPFYVRKLKELSGEMGFRIGTNWIPHDGEIHELSSGISRKETLQSLGLDIRVLPRIQSKGDGIEIVRNQLPTCYFDAKYCDKGIKALETHRKAWDDKNGCYADREMKTWAIHGCDAFKYFCMAMKFESDKNEDLQLIKNLNNKYRL